MLRHPHRFHVQMMGAWTTAAKQAVLIDVSTLPEPEAQTNITAAGDSFYFLEAPETELEASRDKAQLTLRTPGTSRTWSKFDCLFGIPGRQQSKRS